MLFDLRGRRRRAVQVTYLMLAILMGGGLVFFGVGGSVSGGLLDAFKGNSGGSANDAVEKRIDQSEEQLSEHPRNERALKALVRDNYSLAVSQQDPNATAFPESSKDELRKAGTYWKRYLVVAQGNPDPSLASVALRVFDTGALAQPKDAARAMTIIAGASNDFQSYLQLVQYASLAGDERTADLAAQKAEDLAPKNLKKEVKQQAAQLQKAAKQQQAAG
jgi:hypothetical protein